MQRLIVTADDCGLSEGINLATLELHQKGMLNSASVMTNCRAARHALELFAGHPSLSVGVHLNLSEGFPLTQMKAPSGLTDSTGRFCSDLSLYARSLITPRTSLHLIEDELAAQITFFVERRLQAQHLSTHIHFHALPALRAIVFRLARQFHVPWVRPYHLKATVIPLNPFWHMRRSVEVGRAQSAGGPDYLAVLSYWMRRSPEQLLSALAPAYAGAGTVELVVHPCHAQDDTFPRNVRYSPQQRSNETRYLERLWRLLPASFRPDAHPAND